MKTRKQKREGPIKVPEKVLLSLVAAKLKDRVLFPERIEEIRKQLKNAVVTCDFAPDKSNEGGA